MYTPQHIIEFKPIAPSEYFDHFREFECIGGPCDGQKAMIDPSGPGHVMTWQRNASGQLTNVVGYYIPALRLAYGEFEGYVLMWCP